MLLLVDDETGRGGRHGGRPRAELPAGTLHGRRGRHRHAPSARLRRSSRGTTCFDARRGARPRSLIPPRTARRSAPRASASAVELKPTLALRPGDRTRSRTSRPASSTRTTTKGSYVVRRRRGARARLAHVHRLRQPRRRSSPTRSCATRSSATFIWTFVFASLVGLLLVRDRALPGDRARQAGDAASATTYRSLLVIPYAIPGFLMLLVWAGLLNDDFGVVNKLLPGGLDRPWLFDPFWAKVSVIMVTTWLTVPVLHARLARARSSRSRRS